MQGGQRRCPPIVFPSLLHTHARQANASCRLPLQRLLLEYVCVCAVCLHHHMTYFELNIRKKIHRFTSPRRVVWILGGINLLFLIGHFTKGNEVVLRIAGRSSSVNNFGKSAACLSHGNIDSQLVCSPQIFSSQYVTFYYTNNTNNRSFRVLRGSRSALGLDMKPHSCISTLSMEAHTFH